MASVITIDVGDLTLKEAEQVLELLATLKKREIEAAEAEVEENRNIMKRFGIEVAD